MLEMSFPNHITAFKKREKMLGSSLGYGCCRACTKMLCGFDTACPFGSDGVYGICIYPAVLPISRLSNLSYITMYVLFSLFFVRLFFAHAGNPGVHAKTIVYSAESLSRGGSPHGHRKPERTLAAYRHPCSAM